MKMYLFFDTETTGLPKNWKLPATQVDNWPRIIQLGWAMFSEQGELIEQSVELIKPSGWEVPNKPFWINHGYTTEKCLANGKAVYSVLDLFITQLNKADVLVAHNLDFDMPVVQAEMIRGEMKTNVKPTLQRFCTMKSSVNICKLPKNKFPKLEELHYILFKTGFEGAHNAMNDVIATAKCFFEMKTKGLINI